MPFVMAPNLFSKINISSSFQKKERFHQDGIFYDLNSPESFDEIFFSTFEEKDIIAELSNYISLISSYKKHKRYLSKNNSNYKRIDLIQSIFPNSIFLIPFREPLQQANSLLNQHKHFLKLQNKDDFIRRYMNYLGHNEFGKNHKPWNTPKLYRDYNDLSYWLEQWCFFYDNVFNKFKNSKNCYFVNYEKLQDIDYSNHFIDIFDLNKKPKFKFKIKQKPITLKVDEKLYLRSKKIFKALRNHKFINK